MVEVPDALRTLFSASLEKREDRYVVSVPASEVERNALDPGETYRVALLDGASGSHSRAAEGGTAESGAGVGDRTRPGARGSTDRRQSSSTPGDGDASRTGPAQPEPPVDAGERRTVTVEAIGDKGDGIAKVERGYVVIVPGAGPGEEVPVEITSVQQNVAFAEVVEEPDSEAATES